MVARLLLGLSAAFGLVLAIWLGGAVADAAPPDREGKLPLPRAVVRWQPAQVTARLATGQTTYETDVTFTSSITLSNVTIATRAGGAAFLQVTPASIAGPVAPGTPVTVHLKATVPAGAKGRQLSAAVHLVEGNRPLAMPLPVVIVLGPPPPRAQVTWSTPAITPTVGAGSTYETDVTFTSNVTLTQPSVVVMPPPAGRTITVTAGWTGSLAPGTPASVHVKVTVPADFRGRAISGSLQVRDGTRALPKPLPIMLRLNPPAPRPQVTWSTSMISQTVSAGGTYETDVTFTSNVTLTQPSVVVLPTSAGQVITVTPGWTGTLAPGTPASVHVQVSVPADFLDGAAAGPRPAKDVKRGISAMLQVRDGTRAIPRALPVRIQVPSATVTPPTAQGRGALRGR